MALSQERRRILPILWSGICEDHAETQPFVLELFRGESTRALVVGRALVRACTPRPDPVDLPELDG